MYLTCWFTCRRRSEGREARTERPPPRPGPAASDIFGGLQTQHKARGEILFRCWSTKSGDDVHDAKCQPCCVDAAAGSGQGGLKIRMHNYAVGGWLRPPQGVFFF